MKKRMLLLSLLIFTVILIMIAHGNEDGLVSHWTLKSDGGNEIEGAGDLDIASAGVDFETVDGVEGAIIARNSESLFYKSNFDVNFDGPFTMAFFAKNQSTSGFEILLARGTKGDSSHYEVYLESGQLCFYAPSMGDFKSYAFVGDNVMHHIALVYDGSYMNFYIDGYRARSVVANSSLAKDTGKTFTVGRLPEGGMDYEGFIGDIRLYNRALTGNELYDLAFSQGLAPEEKEAGYPQMYNNLAKVYREIFFEDFDGKSAEDIYTDWAGVHGESVADPVRNGSLLARWDIEHGLGYSYRQPFMNVLYDFDLYYGGGYTASVALRTHEDAGKLYGDYQGDHGYGIGIVYASEYYREGVMLVVNDEATAWLRDADYFYLPYPRGIRFLEATHVEIHDLDDTILVFIGDNPFAAIKLYDLVDNKYTRGEVYDGNGYLLGNFNKKIPRDSNFAITNRAADAYLDNFRISEAVDTFTYEGAQIRKSLVPYKKNDGDLDDTDLRQGLRFCFDFPTNNSLEFNGETYQITGRGALVALEKNLEFGKGLRIENVSSENKIINLKNLIPYTEGDKTYLSAYIYNIPEDAKNTVIVALPYIEYTDGEDTFYIYGGAKRHSILSLYSEIYNLDEIGDLDDTVKAWFSSEEIMPPLD